MAKKTKGPRKPTNGGDVGYGRPPKEHQFKPGQSGNPRGRPKGVPTFEDILAREARRFVKLKQGSEVIHMTKLEALVRRVFQMALEGNLSAIRLLLTFKGQAGTPDEEETSNLGVMPDEEAIQRILARFERRPPDIEGKS